jgi:hypothetical protein
VGMPWEQAGGCPATSARHERKRKRKSVLKKGTHFHLAHCPSFPQDNQCSPAPALAVCYFCTYMIICTYLLVQMVIGIIIDNIQAISYQVRAPAACGGCALTRSGHACMQTARPC